MSKGLLQTEHQFTICLKTITHLTFQQPSLFYLSLKTTFQSQSKQIVGDEYIRITKQNQLHFTKPLKVLVKLIFNQESSSYVGKKAVMCLNYILEENKGESILGGLVTLDLAMMVGEGRGSWERGLERSGVGKQVRVEIECGGRKMKEEAVGGFGQAGKKDLSVASIINKTMDKGKEIGGKKIINTRKNINRVIKDSTISNHHHQHHQRQASNINDTTIFHNNTYSLKSVDTQKITEFQLQQLKQQHARVTKRVLDLQKQNQQYKQKEQRNLSMANNHRKVKTLVTQINDLQQYPTDYFENNKGKCCQEVRQQNKYVLQQLQKVSIQLANRQKQMMVLKSEYDKLKKINKKLEKEKQKEQNESMEQQMMCLSGEIMRLHEQLANYRQVEIQNNDLQREKTCNLGRINELTILNNQSIAEVQRLNTLITSLSSKTRQPSTHHTPSLSSSYITNQKLRTVSYQLQKLNQLAHSGAIDHDTTSFKRQFLQIYTYLDTKIFSSIDR